MARILITGASGMLGSKVFEAGRELGHDVYGTARRELPPEDFPRDTFPLERIVHMELTAASVQHALDTVKPQAVINCLGLIKQISKDSDELMRIDAEFPHLLAHECSKRNIRMIQVSTDCVFSGKKGNYSEEDIPDPVDAYGESKRKGEVYDAPHLTIRTSIIGIERGASKSLVSWFLSNKEGSTIKGYTNAIWSGLTTRALAPILYDLAVGKHKDVTGLLHIASAPINKYDLLHLFKEELKHDVVIEGYEGFFCDRSLCADKMRELHILVPSHEEMIREMAARDYFPQHK